MPHLIQLFFGKHEHYDNDLFSYRKLLIDWITLYKYFTMRVVFYSV